MAVFKGTNGQANQIEWTAENGSKQKTIFASEFTSETKRTAIYIVSNALGNLGGRTLVAYYDPDKPITLTSEGENYDKNLQKLITTDQNFKTTITAQTRYHVTNGLTIINQDGSIGSRPSATEINNTLGLSNPPATTDPRTGNGNGSGAAPTPELVPLEIPEIKAKFDQKNHDNLVYPKNLRDNKQDYIKFTSYTYVGRNISPSSTSSGFTPGISERNIKDPKGSAILPIQSSIIDTNTVRWNGEEMNPVGLYAASTSYKMMGNNPGQGVSEAIDQLVKMGGDPNIVNAFKLYAAGNAASVGGLLSRVSGAVLNPNLELLFQGPELRPFDFVFLLSPRNSGEATEVKKIIRFFKESMVVRTTENNLFLKAPNVFDIKYHNGNNDEHTSLNKIKKCALTSCSINYTPSNQYMTFKDPISGYPMTSYNMTLRFQELEPVTDRDYAELKDISETNKHIGY